MKKHQDKSGCIGQAMAASFLDGSDDEINEELSGSERDYDNFPFYQHDPNSGERDQRESSLDSESSLHIIDDPASVSRPTTNLPSRIPVSASRRVVRLPPPPDLPSSFARPSAVTRQSRSFAFPVATRPPVNRSRVTTRPTTSKSFQFASDEEALDCLASLPAMYKQLPPRINQAFSDASERMADAFLAEPSDLAVLNFMCLPKVGLAPGQPETASDRLAMYPEVALPKLPLREGAALQGTASAKKQVEVGRLGHAARLLGGSTSAPSRTPETVEALKAKHPPGTRNPFGSTVGPSNNSPPSTEAIVEALYSFKPDTAPGVSGWTVPLLKVAIRSDSVKKMLTRLVGMFLAGSAPGRELLCSSRLVALEKPDGGIRPIAVGELVYRLCTKAILRHSFTPDFLNTCQFGVGTKGGVEPLIRAVQRVVDGSVENHQFTHITSLDFSNAFNSLDRESMAASIKTHAPGLYRMAKWAYNKPSHLVLGGNGDDTAKILSAQGVRQGDPLGPLFFSIGVRPILEQLDRSLGPDCSVLAYLDDIYVLSNSENTLDRITRFFERSRASLELNSSKSFITSVSEVKLRGLKMLGSCVGPSWARRAFLQRKISELEEKVAKLVDLPHQHALLLLRQCMQQDLRHLQRCLVSDDLVEEWENLDSCLWNAALRIRSSQDPPEPSYRDEHLLSLPVKLGGLGLLSYKTCAPLSFAAATETSDRMLEPILGPAPTPPTLTNADDPDSIAPQRVRCGKAFEAQRDELFDRLDDHQIKTVLESASGLGRKWLSVIPYHEGLRLNNFEVSAALHLRTLHSGSDTVCSQCGVPNTAGHAEVCVNGAPWFIARHEQVKYAIRDTLKTIQGVQVAVEPHIGETNRRNDLRVTGSGTSGLASHEYDITIVSLGTQDAVRTYLPLSLQPTKPAERGHALITKFLKMKADDKRRRLPATTTAFSPLVLTVGGMIDDATAKCLKTWQLCLSPWAFSNLCQRLSLVLLRARAKCFVL